MSQAEVTVYSRPGCPYCYLLRRGLRGNETVPTVHVAGRWLVNPRATHVQHLAATTV